MVFSRGLSDFFLSALLDGPARGILAAWLDADLDVRIRTNAIAAYDLGRRVGYLRHERGRGILFEVHQKYTGADAEGYTAHPVDRGFVDTFAEQLVLIRANAAAYAKQEERVEDAIIRANREPPFVALDRQVQVPGVRRRMDLVGIAEGAFVVVEIKRDLDNRIQDVPRQLSRYLEILNPDGTGLLADVATSYRRVCEQSNVLGVKAPATDEIEARMPVVGLIVLARYNPRSELLDRARTGARNLRDPLYLLQLADGEATIRSKTSWEALCQ